MYENAETSKSIEEAIPERMNIFQRLGSLLFSPKKLFSYTAKRPTLLFPLIVVCILRALGQVLTMDQFYRQYMDIVYNMGKNTGNQIPMDQIENLARGMSIANVFLSPVSSVFEWLILTLILYLIFRLAKCEKGLKKYFSMMAYIMIIPSVGGVLNALYIYFTGDYMLTMVTSLASLLNADTVSNFVYGIASQIEVFNIWTYVLYGIGFTYTGGVQKRLAYIISAAVFIAVTLVLGGSFTLSADVAGLYK
ncbi:hypothetical protein Cst_c27660 [Thermoclostridium stercorarium subsp. stercorarium DSM 8532]|uniref:Yip1 domain-containing protein n=2 Tax=Thermoclostridium stercorarium TaxID=1510 RepID=L7VSZ1_THES1|nr:YIP1 family protein [Thermoclostridium stercorarium]AGC69709.1 hypothetical protein Cst_c27660 [Thermoclostridium stercorarium subsp. stercorarium DSM 8532]AGI40661.1 Yip1 domain-containing protein [Thermoclostridium stercorarium subsp. stercorarium DSM 8532]UZQ85643.1 YIP1 family protein [Thermoclostridium stercorarium]